MSLETVLKIGKIYRYSKQSLEQHRYIKLVNKDVDTLKKSKDKDGKSMQTYFYNLPVIENESEFIFDFDNISEITDEDIQKSLMYLKFKTSDNDSEVKYLFGDIIYSKDKTEKESGNYRMRKITKGKEKSSSFDRANEDAKDMNDNIIGKFRTCFGKNLSKIENILTKKSSVLLHFDFPNYLNWFELENVLDLINKKLVQGFITEDKNTKKIMLKSFLFKTLGGVNPNFSDANIYKTKSFDSIDEVVDLMYGVDISEKILISIKDIGIVALPDFPTDNLSKKQLEDVGDILNDFFKKKGLKDVLSGEDDLNKEAKNTQNNSSINDTIEDDIFRELIHNGLPLDIKYDIIFMKPRGLTSPSVDMLEINNVKKSFLKSIHDNISDVIKELQKQSDIELEKTKMKPKYDIKASFMDILGQKGKNQKKYIFHLLKVLPQIYTGTYYQDPILLPTFIQKTENNLRDNVDNFNILKYDFYFLTNIQKNNNMESITTKKSYAIGQALGIMARPFAAWQPKCPIKSFEKNYVGNLSKRIADLNDLVKFSNFLNEKIIIHSIKGKWLQDASLSLLDSINQLSNSQEKYDKNACALGFFEKYFSRKNDEIQNDESENDEITESI